VSPEQFSYSFVVSYRRTKSLKLFLQIIDRQEAFLLFNKNFDEFYFFCLLDKQLTRPFPSTSLSLMDS